ncbi:MAG: YdiU family protein [Gammaproteobacteria bacterium]|nr:MAG: YdiU family protein [Gammaproteobacteria bacterium]
MSFSLKSIPLHNSFLKLGEDFLSEVKPTPFKSESKLIHFNKSAAKLLDLKDGVEHEKFFTDIFSGKQPLQNAKPFAMLYAGHQFGHFNPQLGDGRAIIIAEVLNKEKMKWELQLKGSGLTPYSRDGDGRAVLRSTIREYLCSEAMHGLGIPTTRALSIIGSADEVYRENIESGAILTRLAPSHIRFGSFEVFYYRHQYDQIRTLADYVLKHYYPELLSESNPYLALLTEMIKRTAKLISLWQSVGFAHGVMNTDNMSILGLTLDYGPYGFLDDYQPGYICNHSDYQGRYAFDQQPNTGLFNLSCFAQAILPLIDKSPDQAAEMAKQELESYQNIFISDFAKQMRKKLGLEQSLSEDQQLIEELLNLMKDDYVDYTIFFRRLCNFDSTDSNNNSAIRDIFKQRDRFEQWTENYQQRLSKENIADHQRMTNMKSVNPKYILRNYMAEVAIKKAEENDFSEIGNLFNLLQNPFSEQPENEKYADFPPEWAQEISVSCSS